MIVVYLFLFIVALFSYIQKKYLHFLLSYFGLMTKLFLLDTSEEILVKGEIFCILINFLLLPVVATKKSIKRTWKENRIAKWISITIIFYVVELILTVYSGRETLFNSIKVVRVSFIMLGFFLFERIPVDVYLKFFRIAFYITVFQSFLFLLQFLGIHLLAGAESSERIDRYGVHFETNTPTLTLFYLYFSLKSKMLSKIRAYFFLLFLLVLFLSFVRATIISVFIGLAYFILKTGEKKYRPIMLIVFSLLIPIAFFFINSKSKESTGESALNDIVNVFTTSDYSQINMSSGTFSFRMAMLAERFIYLMDNPQYLMTGVGTMHEDSPSTQRQFDFIIGTINDSKPSGKCLIESGDITWVPIVLRYGLIGIVIHFIILLLMIKESRNRNDILGILAPVYIGIIITSLTGPYFEGASAIFVLTFFFSALSRCKIENKLMIV